MAGFQASEAMLTLNRVSSSRQQDPLGWVQASNPKVAQFWRSPVKTRCLFGANRSGKTESACIDFLWFMKGGHPYQSVPPAPNFGRIEVTDFLQLDKTILRKFAKYCPPSLLTKGSWTASWKMREHKFLFSNGSVCDFVTHEMPASRLQGASYDIVWMDEEPPQDHYIENVMRTTDSGGKIVMTFTPVNGISWTYEDLYLRSCQEPERIFGRTMSIYENKFLRPCDIAEIEALVTDEVDRDIRLRGIFRSRTGLVFRNFDPEVHVFHEPLPEWDWDDGIPASYLQVVGIDPGGDHPTGIVWVAKDVENERLFVLAERKVRHTLAQDHVEAIFQQNAMLGFDDPLYVMDSQASARDATGTTLKEAYADAGLFPQMATKKLFEGNQYLELLMKVQPVGPRRVTSLYVSEDCPQLVRELRSYQVKKVDGKDAFIDKNNDLISALRYAAWCAKRYQPEQDTLWQAQTVGRTRSPRTVGRTRSPRTVGRTRSPRTGY